MVTTSWPVCWLKRSNFRRRCGTHFGKRPWTSRSEEIMALEATAKPVEVTEDFEEKNSSDSEEKEKEKKKHNIVERSVNYISIVILNDTKSP